MDVVHMKYKFLCFLISIVVLSGCSDNDTIANVDGRGISKVEFENYLEQKNIKLDSDADRKEALANFVERKALAKAAEKSGSLNTGIIEAELEEIKNEILINRYMDKYLDSVVGSQAIENFYRSNEKLFKSKQAHVAHIIVRTNKSMSEVENQAAKQHARNIHAQLSQGGGFEKLVKSHSEDRYSAERDGDLGWVEEGGIHPEFSKAAFSLKPGFFSDVVETPYGFHIIKLIDPVREHVASFESVKGDIRYQLRMAAKQKELARLMENIDYEIK